MKKLLLSGCLLAGLTTFAQTTLFQDDFESGSSQWTLNTGSGANNWTVNNAYLGFAGLIPDTPNQPGSFTNGPQSTYMHITNTSICSGLSVCNANFDTGSASNQNTEITTSIDASSYTNISLSFWYLCAGQTSLSYGTLEYSTDGGSTWIGTGTEYSGVSSWTQETVSIPAWDNSGNFKIRFKWQNGAGGLDPAFSIDEVLITGTLGSAATVSTDNNFAPGNWCYDDVVTGTVGFVATGTFSAGNIFTAELSDASGSFAAPTTIGTLSSTSSGSLSIPVTIAAGTPAGNGYRVRVNSSAPSATGTDNGTDLIIHDLPVVTLGTYTSVCDYTPVFTLTGGLPAGGTYSGTGVGTGSFDPNFAGLGAHNITYTYIDVNGCENTATQSITVDGCASMDELSDVEVRLYPNPATDVFSIIGDGIQTVSIIDLKGRVVRRFENQDSYNIQSLVPGVYSVVVTIENGVKSFKLIKE